jgi:AcrR family transcriptional regulator
VRAHTKAEQAGATKEKLERVAKRLFAARGFADVSAEEIVARAGVTRGALYHHYGGKAGLFEAVLDSVMRELHARLLKEGARLTDPVLALEHGVDVFLRACSEPATQRILLIDGPAVLGWTAWREMDGRYGLGLLKRGIKRGVASGRLRRLDSDMLAHVLLGAMTEAAMVVARSSDPATERKSAHAAIASMIGSWRISP